jgi:MFS family permease
MNRSPRPIPWYYTITAEQWKTLLAAQLGWMLDAMDFTLYLMAINTIQQEFGLTNAASGLVTTVGLLTSAAGGLLFGVVADKVGRTRALTLTILIFSLCSLGSATAQNLLQLIVWRSLLGFGMGGEWAAGAVLVSETWPPEHRGKAIGIMQSGWALGYILAAVLAAVALPTLGWRGLFALGGLPALFILWVRRHVPEPDVWTARQTGERRGNPFAEIFGRALLRRTLLASALTTTVMFAYWGLFSWLPSFLGKPVEQGGAGLDVVTSMAWLVPLQLGAFFGYLSFGFLEGRFGRKPTFVAFLLASAALAPVYGLLAREQWILMLIGPVLGFVGHGYFSVFGALLAELYPTRVRGTGQGFTYNAGRALSAAAPPTVGALADAHGMGVALAFTSLFFVAGALTMLLIPDTSGRKLED